MKLIWLFLFTLLCFTGSNAQAVSNKPDLGRLLDEYLRSATATGFSGAVLVAKDGKILLRKGYGWADKNNENPITAESVFDIGSHVKAFTATAIMQLEQRGKLTTSDPITKYFQKVPADKTQITIHHLLTHTSGLEFDYFYNVNKPDEHEILRDRERYVPSVLSFPLGYETGKGRRYSNTGFALLAAIIEKITGQTYLAYVQENIFKPAGMNHTGYTIPRNYKKLVARGYNDGPTEYGFPWTLQWDKGTSPLWDLAGNGGMLSTVDEMYKWALALQGEKIVSKAAKDKMFTVHYTQNDQGYGWYVSKTPKGDFNYVHHSGDAVPHGWNMDFRLFRDRDLVVIVLTNKRIRAGSIRRPTVPVLVDIALYGEAPRLPPFVSVDRSKLKAYEGVYRFESGAMLHIKADEFSIEGEEPSGQLIVSGEGQKAIDLIFSGNETAGLTRLSLDLNNRMKAFIDALSRNDAGVLKTILPATVSAETAIQNWNSFVKTTGELLSFEVLGSSPLNQTGVQTFVRLNMKNGGGVYHVTWRDQKLHDQAEDSLQPQIAPFLRKSMGTLPLTIPFTPQSETHFAAYDLFKGRTMKFEIKSDGTLVFQTKDGPVVARKVQRK